MSRWAWWAGAIGEVSYDIVAESPTRDACIREACRKLVPGDTFRIVEAQLSQAEKYEGADFVPFIRQRGHEIVTVGPRDALAQDPRS